VDFDVEIIAARTPLNRLRTLVEPDKAGKELACFPT